MSKKSKKKIDKLEKLCVFPSNDKDLFMEKYENEEELLNGCYVRHPFKACLISKTNGGKTNVIKNLLVCNNFEKIYVVHGFIETKDYEDVDIERLSEFIPDINEIDKSKKTLIIFEDLNLRKLPKQEQNELAKYVKTYSSHGNISLIFATQYFFELSPLVRENCDVYMIWYQSPKLLDEISDRCNLPKNILKTLMENHIRDRRHDFVVFDNTRPKYNYRKNLLEILDY
jgi:hypothetical protein